MTQADSVHSTPPTNTPVATTRRRFLSTAAGVAVGSAALALATTPPASAANDPVCALIGAHRAADASLGTALAALDRAEDRCHPEATAEAGAVVDAAHAVEQAALVDLIESVPASLAGVIASMTYIAGLSDLDWGRIEDGAIGPLLKNLAEALEGLAVAS